RYGPGFANVTDSLTRPSAPIGGCLWMIVERSRRTMIRWTPVWGPGPVRYVVSGAPDGWSTVNEIVVGTPARTAPVGLKPARWNVFAAETVGTAGPEPDEPQPERSTSGAARRTREARTDFRIYRQSAQELRVQRPGLKRKERCGGMNGPSSRTISA